MVEKKDKCVDLERELLLKSEEQDLSTQILHEPPTTFSPGTTPQAPHIKSIFQKKTHHNVHRLLDGVDERPDPFAVGL